MTEKLLSQAYKLYIDENLEKSSRLGTGSYYTPLPTAEKMASKALELFTKGNGNYFKSHSYSQLANIKFADLSCGSGIFVIAWLVAIDNALRLEYKLSKTDRDSILCKAAGNIVMIDIDEKALSHFNCFINENCPVLENTIHQENINPLTDSSLSYLKEKYGEFDIILGNPPYIGERGNLKVFNLIKNESLYKENYQGKMDYFYFFFYRAYELLAKEGVVGYLCSSYFTTADGASRLRDFLREKVTLREIVSYGDKMLFKSAPGHHSMEIFFEKSIPSKDSNVRINFEHPAKESHMKKLQSLFDAKGQIMLHSLKVDALIEKIHSKCKYSLGELFHVKQGLVSGLDYDNLSGKGVFVVSKDEANSLNLEKTYLKPFYKNSHIRHGIISKQEIRFIIYTNKRFTDETDFKKNAPNIYAHLLPWKDKLLERRESKLGIRQWYELHWPRDERIFIEPAIVCPHRSSRNHFAISTGNFYASADVYYIFPKTEATLNHDQIQLLCQILNSNLYFYLLKMTGKRKGKVLELYATPLKNLKIPCLEELLIFFQENKNNQSDKLIYNYFALNDEDISLCQGK